MDIGKKLPEEKLRQRIKTVLIISVSLFVVLSGIIFISSRGDIREGISVEFTIRILDDYGNISIKQNQLVAGKEAQLTFVIKDNKTGETITGLNPDIRYYFLAGNKDILEHQHIASAIFGKELNPARIQLFVVNSQRGTIEIADIFGNNDPRPQTMQNMGLSSSKLIAFKGAPKQRVSDFISGRFGNYLYASLPDENQVAVINTVSKEVEKYIDVGARPGLLFLQPNSTYLWVGNDGSSSVSIIDTANNTLVKTIMTGEGYHQVAFSQEFAYVTNNRSNTVSVIKLKGLTKTGYSTVEVAPYGIDYSRVSNSIFVANTYSGTVNQLDDRTHDMKARIILSPGIETVKVSPDGRWAVVLNQYEDKAYLIETKTGSLNRTVRTAEGPDHVVFMDDYAIIHNIYNNVITYIHMNDTNISNNVPVGIQAPLKGKPHGIAVSYYGDEVVLTNPRDPYVYFMHTMYGEPMLMGSASVSFGSDAVAIVENKFHETDPGVYQQYVKFDRPGPYDLEFRSYKMNATFRIEVLPDENTKDFQITALFGNQTFKPGIPLNLQYQILDKKTGEYQEDIKDVIFIVIKPPSIKGIWSERIASRPIGNGTYEATITFPDEGRYILALSSDSMQSKGYSTKYEYITVASD